MDGIEVVGSARRLAASLAPMRQRLLAALDEPDSAAGIARRLDLPRQKVTYHLRALEDAGLVTFAGERQRRGFVERVVRRVAPAIVVDPGVLGGLAHVSRATRDRFSSTWLIALAARVVHEVAALRARADAAGQRLPTVAVDADVSFATPRQVRAFADDVQASVAQLALRHGTATQGEGRLFRVTVGVHPAMTKPGITPTDRDTDERDKDVRDDGQ